MIIQTVGTEVFYAVAALSIVFAVATVTSRRMLRAAICLMSVLVLSAGLYVMLAAEFLAGVQVMVYVGGIVAVIVFVIMLTSTIEVLEAPPSRGRMVMGALASLAFLGATALVILSTRFPQPTPGRSPAESARAIGHALLDSGADGYVLPFEIISLLLLAVIIGGIVVARRSTAPGQPLTSGGDLPGEVRFVEPKNQNNPPPGAPHA